MELQERLKVVKLTLQIATIVVASIVPAVRSGSKVAAVFVMFTVLGSALGWRFGNAEARPRSLNRVVLTLALWWIGIFVCFLFLENMLPYLGRSLPVIYSSDTLFWSLVLVRAVLWGALVGIIVRLLALLERLAPSSTRE